MLPNWSPASTVATTTDLLIADASAASYGAALRDKFRVDLATTGVAALQFLRQASPSLVIADLALENGSAIEICRLAKQLATPSTVLVTAEDVQLVPAALEAGCDGVLLKPFQPNLLHARIGRLLRARSAALRLRSQRAYAKADHLRDRADLLMSATNRHWPSTYCPYCQHQGVTSFEFASHRKAWYACLDCKKVWMAKRQE